MTGMGRTPNRPAVAEDVRHLDRRRLCAKIGLFQSSRSVFGQASISARKPIAGESNHALSRKRRCWQGTDIEDRPGLNTGTSHKQVSTPRRWAATHRMWHPLRGVLEPFSEHRLLLARGHGSPYHQRAQNGYSAASEGAPRWRGSGRLQKRSVEHASHRRGPTSDSAILSELARCYCLRTARAQAACQGVDCQLTKTTGLHRTMAKVCKSGGQDGVSRRPRAHAWMMSARPLSLTIANWGRATSNLEEGAMRWCISWVLMCR